jgi:hypothetical protein
MTRGDSAMRGGGAGRWEVAAQGEAMQREATQQPAGLEAQEGARAARTMALATRVVWDKEGNGNSSDGDGNKGGRQAMAMRAMATAMALAMVTAMRMAGNKEGKDKGSNGNGDGYKGGG